MILGHYRHSCRQLEALHENLKDRTTRRAHTFFFVTFGLLVAGNRSLMLTDRERAATA